MPVRLMLTLALAWVPVADASASGPLVARIGEREVSLATIRCDAAIPADYCDVTMQANLNARIADMLLAAATDKAGVRLRPEEVATFKKKHLPSDASIASLEKGWKAVIEGAKLVQSGLTANEAYENTVKSAGVPQAVFVDFLSKVKSAGALQAFQASATSAALRAQLERDAEMQLKLERIEAWILSSCGDDVTACDRARTRFWDELLQSNSIRILDPHFHAELPTFIPGERHETK